MADQLIFQLPKGRFKTFDDNEVHVASDNADPAKVRVSIKEEHLEFNLGMVSCNTERPDGELDELVTFGARMLEKNGRPAFVVTAGKKNEQHVELLIVTLDGIYGAVEFKGPMRPSSFTRSVGGNCERHMQDDGNDVIYDVRPGLTMNGQPVSGTHGWVALWASRGGEIRTFRQDGKYVG